MSNGKREEKKSWEFLGGENERVIYFSEYFYDEIITSAQEFLQALILLFK